MQEKNLLQENSKTISFEENMSQQPCHKKTIIIPFNKLATHKENSESEYKSKKPHTREISLISSQVNFKTAVFPIIMLQLGESLILKGKQKILEKRID